MNGKSILNVVSKTAHNEIILLVPITIVCILIELVVFRVLPANDRDKVSHEAGDFALHEGVVANDDVLLLGARLV